jgi:hypothetical protein
MGGDDNDVADVSSWLLASLATAVVFQFFGDEDDDGRRDREETKNPLATTTITAKRNIIADRCPDKRRG